MNGFIYHKIFFFPVKADLIKSQRNTDKAVKQQQNTVF